MSPHPTIEVYGRPGCSWCQKARDLLTQHGIPFEYIDFSQEDPALKTQLLQMTGATTVPLVFIEDEYIGGYDHLAARVLRL